MTRLRYVLALALATAVLGAVAQAQADAGRTRLFRFLMGTSVRVELSGGDPLTRAEVAQEAFAAVAEVERLMSDYRKDSELSRLNATAASGPVVVSGPLFAVVTAAERVQRASGGAFTAVVSAHDVARPVTANAADHTIRFAHAGVRLSLDGLAKGFAAELAAASLSRRGFSGTVDIGGVQYMVGLPVGKRVWSVGVADPVQRDALLGALDVVAGAVATAMRPPSAHTAGGTEPAALRTLSATVVSNDGTLADALSRAAAMMAPEEALQLLARFPDTWGLVVARQADGRLTTVLSAGHASAFHPSAVR
ncbi:MAG: FAD:protein FMN transferase [Vicinamibacterales bacterium]